MKLIVRTVYMKKFVLLLTFLFSASCVISQRAKSDSLRALLTKEKIDTNKVRLMWQLAGAVGVYNPDTALILSFEALTLAKKINYLEGESRSIGAMANTFIKLSNYPKALELHIQKLKLEEKRKNPRNMASVLNNIGIVYFYQDEYRTALEYFFKADTLTRQNNVEDMKYFIALNLGDTYNRLNISDSAFTYFNKSLELAKVLNDGDLIGTSMTGLGHSFLKLGSYKNSLLNYQTAITYLQEAGDDEVLCEATLGIANLYEQMGKYDSAAYFANISLSIAKKDGFLAKELDAAEFLTDHYKKIKHIDSAFNYVSYVRLLNDSINSKSKIRESQIISSNEHIRQLELEESNRLSAKERYEQLQMLLIAIFIPGIFIITLLLSRVNMHTKLIRLLGVISLLFLFEYLTLLLHPTVARLTNHTPIYEILIFVGVAAILIPLHHRLEQWLIHKLIHHRHSSKVKKTEQ